MRRFVSALLVASAACSAGKAHVDGAEAAADTGAEGADGADGSDGSDGVDGADGADGSDGADGTDGGLPDCLDYGVVWDEGVTLDTSGRVDAWDSATGAYNPSTAGAATLATNAVSDCAVRVQGGTLSADVWVGPGAYPDEVVCTSSFGTHAGAAGVLDEAVPLLPATLPAGLPASTGDKALSWSETVTFSADRVLDSLTLETSAVLTVDTPMALHVQGDVRVDGATLALAPGATLDLYVDGALTVQWSGRLGDADDPGAVRVFMLGDGPVTLGTSGQLAALLVHPTAPLEVNGAQLFGAAWGRSAEVTWSGAVHVDDALLCR